MFCSCSLPGSHPDLDGSGKAAEIFRSVDLDGRGVIDYTEFVAACLDHKVEQEESVTWRKYWYHEHSYILK